MNMQTSLIKTANCKTLLFYLLLKGLLALTLPAFGENQASIPNPEKMPTENSTSETGATPAGESLHFIHDSQENQQQESKLTNSEAKLNYEKIKNKLTVNLQEFNQGLKAYSDKNFKQASANFKASLSSSDPKIWLYYSKQPEVSKVLFNIALTEIALGQGGDLGLAVAIASHLYQRNPLAEKHQQLYRESLKKLEIKQLPRELSGLEVLTQVWIFDMDLGATLFTLWLCFMVLAWKLYQLFALKKQALKEERTLPSADVVLIASALMFFFLSAMVSLKLRSMSQSWGHILAKEVKVLTAPNEKAPSLFSLYQGLEFRLLDEKNGFWFVSYPGGLSGWIRQDAAIITSSYELWSK